MVLPTAPPTRLPTREEWYRASPALLAQWASGGAWTSRPHLDLISDAIADAVARGGGRIIVNMPPGMGKSLLLSKWVPIWFHENWPEQNVIVTAHGAEFAAGFGRAVRNEFATNPLLTTKISEDSSKQSIWHTRHGGMMVTGGVGSGIMGRRGNLLTLDDPYRSPEDAASTTYRRKLEEWMESVLLTRCEPGATVVVLHHRMHYRDLTAHLLEGPDGARWKHIRLPALAEANDPLGRLPGEAIYPARFTAEEMERERLSRSAASWQAMYQQNPLAVGGGVVYPQFSQANLDHAAVFNHKDPLHFSIDFNRNPSMHIVLGQYDTKADVFTAVYELTESRSLRDSLEEFARWVKEQGGWKFPAVWIYGDPAGSGHSTQTGDTDYDLIRAKMRQMGIACHMRVASAHPPIIERVNAFNDALKDVKGEVHYKAHPRCVRLIRDFREQQADDEGKPDETNPELGHAAAAEGYRVHYARRVGGRVEMPKGRFSVTVRR